MRAGRLKAGQVSQRRGRLGRAGRDRRVCAARSGSGSAAREGCSRCPASWEPERTSRGCCERRTPCPLTHPGPPFNVSEGGMAAEISMSRLNVKVWFQQGLSSVYIPGHGCQAQCCLQNSLAAHCCLHSTVLGSTPCLLLYFWACLGKMGPGSCAGPQVCRVFCLQEVRWYQDGS